MAENSLTLHGDHSETVHSEAFCTGFGPQTPRDIDNLVGENKQIFAIAPRYQEMNLCNIHFHSHAEHKAKDFSIYAEEGDHDYGGSYQCNASQSLTKAELVPSIENACKGVHSGGTIEVHWVYIADPY